MRTRALFAQKTLPLETVSDAWKKIDGVQFLAVFGAILVVVLLSVLWAVYFRKRRRHHSHHSRHHHHRQPGAEAQPAESTEQSSLRKRRKWRRRRRDHRPRNPTLAETGGMPPLRSERPPEPFP